MRLLMPAFVALLLLAVLTTPAAACAPDHEDLMREHDAIAYKLKVSAPDDFEWIGL